jgi:hypothetical protein
MRFNGVRVEGAERFFNRTAVVADSTSVKLDKAQAGALLARTRDAAASGRFELYKTSVHFNGTIKNPLSLG